MSHIVKMYFGSQLYGTATPESDTDIKGVFLPSREQCYLNKIPKCLSSSTKVDSNSKNSASDVDAEIYSLQYFIELAVQGETIAMDMLHAPRSMWIGDTSPIWEDIIANREKFYTKNLRSFVSYARKQAAKYGIKGSRLSTINSILDVLRQYDPGLTLRAVWNQLPILEHTTRISGVVSSYVVCGKQLQDTSKISYVIPILERYKESYGERARQAESNEGIDWKAVSHALRAAYQVKEILTEGTITFPLKEAAYLLKVKKGELHFVNEVSPRLEGLMIEVEELSNQSLLPEKCDRSFWDQFIIDVYSGR